MDNQIVDSEGFLEHLNDLLNSVDRPGNYCVGDKLYVPMPQIIIDGVGSLGFPVSQVQIDTLIEVAERAPFGKGTETILDTSVRDCWQIDADQVHVSGGAWLDTFAKIMNFVTEGLGIEKGDLGAELYKLLIYQEGGFFATHRDTEKAIGMIATLTLSLPVDGEGGELVIRHGGEETVYNMSAQEPSELSYAAFYADCLHEVRPVTKGHRISLVFNLFIQSDRKWTGAPEYAMLTEEVKSCLNDWAEHVETEKAVWVLNHSYSEEGLSFDTLKGVDAAVAQVLGEAADGADCDIHAAVLYIRLSGYPDMDYNVGDWGETGSTIHEVSEREEILENWIARDGSNPPFGELSVEGIEVIQPGAIDHAEPDEKLFEDYMGNYGPTMDLIYRFAALVVWPKENTLEILVRESIHSAVSWVTMQRNRLSDTEMQHLLSKLVDLWPNNDGSSYRKLPQMLQLLVETKNADIAEDFLSRIVVTDYHGEGNEQIASLMQLIGTEAAKKFLINIVKQHVRKYPKEILSLLMLITKNLEKTESVWRDVQQEMIRTVASNFRAVLEENTKSQEKAEAIQRSEAEMGRRYIFESDKKKPLDTVVITNLFALVLGLDLIEESINIAKAVADFPKAVSPDRKLPEVLEEMNKGKQARDSRAYQLLWQQSADFLLRRSNIPPKEPKDWRIDAEIPLYSNFFVQLQAFCQSSEVRVHRIKAKKDIRANIEWTIKNLNLDIDCTTERKNRPYTLVCTKNRASYREKRKVYSDDLHCMDRLLAVAPQDESGNREKERILRIEEAKVASKSR